MAQVHRSSKSDISLSRALSEERVDSARGQRWLAVVVAVALFAAALYLNVRHLGTPSIWFDEAFSVELARQPLPLLWHIIFGPEPNMELYYLFLHFWLGLTGAVGLLPTEAVVRFPSAIFAALSTVAVFLLGRRFLGLIAGTIATGLYLLNYLQLIYAQQTRSYSLQLLVLCLSWYALLVALSHKERARNWWLVYVIATALSVYAHLFSLLIILSQVIAVVVLMVLPNAWRKSVYMQLRSYCISLFTMGVLIMPMLLESRQGAKTGWLAIPHASDVQYLLGMFSGFSKSYLLMIGLFCVIGVIATCVLYLFSFVRHTVSPEDSVRHGLLSANLSSPAFGELFPVMVAFLCWFVIPSVLSYIVSRGSLRLFSTRYLVTVVPALCLLMGLGISVLRWPFPSKRTALSSDGMANVPRSQLFSWLLQGVLGLLLLALALPAVPQYYRSAQVEDWNTISHWIMQQYQQGDGLVCYDNDVQQGCQISVEYYLHAYPSAAHFSSDTPGAFSWQRFASSNPDAAVDPAVLAAYGANYGRIFYIVGRLPNEQAATKAQAAQQWLDSHYHLVGKFEKRTVTVRLYETH